MRKSSTTAQLNDALAAAQGAYKPLVKNKEVLVKTRTGGTYKFKYADLGAVIASVRDALSANGLSFTQTLERGDDGKFRLETTLWHKGEFIGSETPLFIDKHKDEEIGSQAFGSALTFMKRYALSGLLGVAADDDDDANLAEGNEANFLEKAPKSGNGIGTNPIKPVVATPAPSKPTEPTTIPPPPEPTPGGMARPWRDWGKTFLDHVKSTPGKVDEWLSLNAAALEAMEREAPKTRKLLGEALEDQRARLPG